MAAPLAPFVGTVLGLAFGTLCHEFGHMVCGKAASIRIQRCVVGRGPVLLRWHWQETVIEIHAMPFGGYNRPYPVLPPRKCAEFLFYVGGVLGNVAAVGLILLLGAMAKLSADIGGMMVLVQAVLIVLNLFPRRTRGLLGEMDNDGLRLLRLLRRPPGATNDFGEAYLEMLRRYCPDVDASALSSRHAPVILHWAGRQDRITDPKHRSEALQTFEQLLRGRLAVAEELCILDMLITDGIFSDPPYPVATLDTWSRRAMELAPASKPVRESRASVLIELGEAAAGKDMLLQLGKGDADVPGVLRRLFLAKAEHRLGNDDAAQRLLVEAHQIAVSAGLGAALLALVGRFAAEFDADQAAANTAPMLMPGAPGMSFQDGSSGVERTM